MGQGIWWLCIQRVWAFSLTIFQLKRPHPHKQTGFQEKTLNPVEKSMIWFSTSGVVRWVKGLMIQSFIWKLLAILGHLLNVNQKHGYQIYLKFECYT